jgi:hypothetical protein
VAFAKVTGKRRFHAVRGESRMSAIAVSYIYVRMIALARIKRGVGNAHRSGRIFGQRTLKSRIRAFIRVPTANAVLANFPRKGHGTALETTDGFDWIRCFSDRPGKRSGTFLLGSDIFKSEQSGVIGPDPVFGAPFERRL